MPIWLYVSITGVVIYVMLYHLPVSPLTVSNGGPSDASNVVATTPLPPGADFVSATASQGLAPVLQAGQISTSL